MAVNYVKSTAGGPVVAKCPKCGKYHKTRIAIGAGTGGDTSRMACEWTGRGIPRIYCEPCKIRLGMVQGYDCPRLEYDTIEGRI